ncbi:hypothetical protein P7H20_25650 [Paenibacillus larvae]|nr:hypothetical protein [Paenibacillus larvae]MDT2277551.1 hypothetical protein [Paenibacillus larvae]
MQLSELSNVNMVLKSLRIIIQPKIPVENIPAYEPTRKDITQEVDVTATSPEPKIEHPKQQTTAETDDEKLRQLKAEMKEV